MNCACYIHGEHPLALNPCPEHERWAKAVRAHERERCATMVEALREQWFNPGVPGDLAVPAGAFARSMKELAAVMRDPNVDFATSSTDQSC